MRAPAKGLGPREARAARARAEGTMAERDGAEGARAVRGQGQDGAIQGAGGKGEELFLMTALKTFDLDFLLSLKSSIFLC